MKTEKKIIWQDRKENPLILVYEDGTVHYTENLDKIDLFDIIGNLASCYANGVKDLKESFSFWQHNMMDDRL